jgi:hypothetical protein
MTTKSLIYYYNNPIILISNRHLPPSVVTVDELRGQISKAQKKLQIGKTLLLLSVTSIGGAVKTFVFVKKNK